MIKGALTSLRLSFDLAAVSLIVVTIGLTYGQVLGHQFVAWDDFSYVSENAKVLEGVSWHGVIWAFSTFQLSNWHPVTLLSHMLDVSIWGPQPGIHAAVNVALHGANALLLYGFVRRVTPKACESFTASFFSVAVALVFAVHPLHVESVAWISERKDVLCAFFWLLAMHAHFDYVRRPSGCRYALTTLWIALSLLSKPMAVTLPLALLIIDWWPLRRTKSVFDTDAKRLLFEKLPWLALAIATGYLTVLAQTNAMPAFNPLERAQLAIVAYGWYLEKTFWPSELHFYYLTERGWSGLRLALSAIVMLFTSLLAFRWRKSYPAFTAGWVWFLLTLLPVVGFVKVGTQAWADRYAYLPHIGLFGMFFSLVSVNSASAVKKMLLTFAFFFLVAVFGWLSHAQVAVWKNTTTLYQNALANNPDHYVALMGLANHALRQGDYGLAERYSEQALSLSSGPALVRSMRNVLGDVALKAGNIELAIRHFEVGRDSDHLDDTILVKLGLAYMNVGRLSEAESAFREAISRVNDSVDALNGLGVILGLQGRWVESYAALEQGIALAPRHRGLRHNLAATAIRSGNYVKARNIYRDLLAFHPEDVVARDALSKLAERNE